MLLAFLRKHFEPAERQPQPPRREIVEDDERELRGLKGFRDGFLAQVERVALLHHPGATVVCRPAPLPFVGSLEIGAHGGSFAELRLVGAVEQDLWDIATGTTLCAFEGHKNSVWSVAFSADGKTLASGSSDDTLRLWDIATARCLYVLLATHEGWAAFTPDGRYKFGGDLAGSFWHVVGLCRFEPGELDPYIPGLRLPDDASFLTLPPWEPPPREP